MSIEQARDPLLRNSMAAMRRAAQRARKVALTTHTDLIVAKGGQWQRISPAQIQEEGAKYGAGAGNTEKDQD